MKLRLATINDCEAIARVHCDSWDAAFSQFAPEIVKARGNQFPRRKQHWDALLNDKQLFTYVAVENDEIIGFGQGGQVREELEVPYDGELVRLYVAPDAKGRGIGKKLINKVATTLKEQGNTSLVVVAWSINTPARKVYEHLGAKFIKEIVQEKDGFDNSQAIYVWKDINTAIEATSVMIIRDTTLEDAIGIANVHFSSWQTSYKGLMPDEAIAARSVEQRQSIWERILGDEESQSINLVAELEGKIVGFASGGSPQEIVDGFDGELYAIYLLQDAQGKGIGRKLMKTLATRMHKAGFKNLLLSVLKNNTKSRGFYEKMGGTLLGEGEYQVTEDVTLTTIKYGWKDIRTLVVEG